MTRNPDQLSFWDHAEELRRKILVVLVFFAACFLFSYFFYSERVVDWLIRRSGRDMYYLSVFEPFLTRLRVSAAVSILAAIPLLLIQTGRFVLPGLYPAERAVYVLFAVLFFVLAAAVGFALLRFSPLILSLFLETFASPEVSFRLSVATLISFYLMLLLGDAAVILLPIVVFVLMKLGLLTAEGVRRSRKLVIVLFLLVAAMITPPDPFTMIAVALPLWGVYEASLLAMRLLDRLSVRSRNRSGAVR